MVQVEPVNEEGDSVHIAMKKPSDRNPRGTAALGTAVVNTCMLYHTLTIVNTDRGQFEVSGEGRQV